MMYHKLKYGADDLRSIYKVWPFNKASSLPGWKERYKRSASKDNIKEFSLVNRRALPTVLSQERPKAWPQAKNFLNYNLNTAIIYLSQNGGI